jgi:uncharacterized membrane protein
VTPARALLSATFVVAGLLHFRFPRAYAAIMPPALPAPMALVYASGVAELAGGLGVAHPRTSRLAGRWLAATLVAVFPANVHMALRAERFPRVPAWALWARLPLQLPLVAWALRATR